MEQPEIYYMCWKLTDTVDLSAGKMCHWLNRGMDVIETTNALHRRESMFCNLRVIFKNILFCGKVLAMQV